MLGLSEGPMICGEDGNDGRGETLPMGRRHLPFSLPTTTPPKRITQDNFCHCELLHASVHLHYRGLLDVLSRKTSGGLTTAFITPSSTTCTAIQVDYICTYILYAKSL